MVFKYLRPSKASVFQQQKMFRKIGPAVADKTVGKINTTEIIKTAENRSLHAGWGRVSVDARRRLEQLAYFLEEEKLPLIVCQSASRSGILCAASRRR
jgi:hypothetical protein